MSSLVCRGVVPLTTSLCQLLPKLHYSTLTQKYKDEVAKGKLLEDPRQLILLEKLEEVRHDLENYEPAVNRGFFSKLFSSAGKSEEIQGLYVHGGVGCGKTMIMDMFYDEIHSKAKLRTHFHDFMLDVHERIHAFKQTLPASHIKDRSCYDPIPVVAKEIASETFLLCFDEFQVTDVADAMILRRLFETLFDEGIVMIATANRAPDDLYKNGLQRTNFLPFIPLLKSHCNLLDMDSPVDYRMMDPKPLNIPGGSASFVRQDSRLDEIFSYLTADKGEMKEKKVMSLLGRELCVGVSSGKVLMTTYQELCEHHHGSSDFRAIARNFSHVLIKDFPQLSIKYRTPLRRFIVMMDIFYDRGVKLVLSAHVPISQIIDITAAEESAADDLRMLMDDLKLTMSEAKSMNLFTGEDEAFSQKRALSRLFEMQCADYWDVPHKPT